eukprot:scaffold117034_cov22-Tisochrysis_lutea.AAC.7
MPHYMLAVPCSRSWNAHCRMRCAFESPGRASSWGLPGCAAVGPMLCRKACVGASRQAMNRASRSRLYCRGSG